MNLDDLFQPSYKGAEWFVPSSSLQGGRKWVKKQFVNSDRQSLEDVGLLEKTFTLNGTISARRDVTGKEVQSYLSARRNLLSALDSPGTGVLVHPTFGKIENIAAMSYNLGEENRALGEGSISITFDRDTSGSGLPIISQDVLAGVVEAAKEVDTQAKIDITNRFAASKQFTGNFADALDKANGFIAAANRATQPFAIIADELDGFSKLLSDFGTSVTTLVNSPTAFADSISGVFSSFGGLFATFKGTLSAFELLFDFGEDDLSIVETTAGLLERKQNRDVVNANVQSLALSNAFVSAAQINFRDTSQIEEISSSLDKQYQKLVESGLLNICVKEALSEQRIISEGFFNTQRDIRPRVVTIYTPPTSARLLAYQHYGSSELGETIAELNGFGRLSFIQGDVKILTS